MITIKELKLTIWGAQAITTVQMFKKGTDADRNIAVFMEIAARMNNLNPDLYSGQKISFDIECEQDFLFIEYNDPHFTSDECNNIMFGFFGEQSQTVFIFNQFDDEDSSIVELNAVLSIESFIKFLLSLPNINAFYPAGTANHNQYLKLVAKLNEEK